MADSNISSETNNALESSLKDLLDKILNFYEKFIKTKEELAALENKLNDYENVLELVEITKNVFTSLAETIDQRLQTVHDDNYAELEKIVQRHEGEIRNHIRIEQQIKLYAESIQAKLEESEKTRADLLDQTKNIINGVKRDNQKLSEALKQKVEEYEQISNKVKTLEELNREYKEKLQELPQLQERINNLERKNKTSNPKVINVLKDFSQNSYDIENTKKSEIDIEFSRINTRPESTSKPTKNGGSQRTSPLKFISRNLSNAVGQGTKNKDYIKVRVEMSENKNSKELDNLKQSYQRFYNPNKPNVRDREKERDRNSSSINKTRELKQIYSIPLVTNCSNSSLIQINHNLSHRDHALTKLHQRSSSHGGRKTSSGKLDENL